MATFETYVRLNQRLQAGGQGWSDVLRRMGDPLSCSITRETLVAKRRFWSIPNGAASITTRLPRFSWRVADMTLRLHFPASTSRRVTFEIGLARHPSAAVGPG